MAVRRDCEQLTVVYMRLMRDSQGTWNRVDRGSLVPTEFVVNILTVWFSPLVKFWSSWLISTNT